MPLLRLKKPPGNIVLLFASLENVRSVNHPRREWAPSDKSLKYIPQQLFQKQNTGKRKINNKFVWFAIGSVIQTKRTETKFFALSLGFGTTFAWFAND